MEKLEGYVQWVATASVSDLKNHAILAEQIGQVGLFFDNRHSPHDSSKSMYGNDVKYMLPEGQSGGTWQTPTQLASFLIFASEKAIKTYMDVGTLTGWTTTIVTAYLKRFGLEHVDSYDVFSHLGGYMQDLWTRTGLPIQYHLTNVTSIVNNTTNWMRDTYDLIFIDGDHSYTPVRGDYERYKLRARLIVFHDINDFFCVGVVKLWSELKEENKDQSNSMNCIMHEFIEHPNGYRLMGIGVVEWV